MKTGRPITGTQKKIRKTICIDPQHIPLLKTFLAELGNTKVPNDLSHNKVPTDLSNTKLPEELGMTKVVPELSNTKVELSHNKPWLTVDLSDEDYMALDADQQTEWNRRFGWNAKEDDTELEELTKEW